MAAIDQGRSVLVAAPTGAGKTVVADHAVDRALAQGRKTFYTTPIKALSNQKYTDLSLRLGTEQVGLLTGDRRVNPGAPVVVMTTEVLRALLYERVPMLDGLATIILDEAHFITDPFRGPAWEEVVIHSPAATQLVALSATVDEADVLAEWIRSVHGETTLIQSAQRPVELRHLYAIGRPDRSPLMLLPVEIDGSPNPTAMAMDGPRVRETRGEGLRKRTRSRTRAVPPTRREVADELARADLLPAIWFVLSRVGCERAAAALLEAGPGFTNHAEAVELRSRADAALGGLDQENLRGGHFGAWAARLSSGVATHHGGLLPVQREVVEKAFAQGLVKVAFATETLALGVNLPARTVVIDRVRRSDGSGNPRNGTGDHSRSEGEKMSASTFTQLAGRAGRRGLDRTGAVVVPWAEETSFLEVAAMVAGLPRPLVSWFRPTPVMVANLVTGSEPGPPKALASSLHTFLARRQSVDIKAELDRIRGELAEVRTHECSRCQGPSLHASSTPAMGPRLAALRPGDVFLDPGRPGTPPAVVVAEPRKRRGLVAVDLVRGDGRRLVVTEADLRQAPMVMARVELADWTSTERGHAKAAIDALAALNLTSSIHEARRLGRDSAGGSTRAAACPAPRRARMERAVSDLEARIDELEDDHTSEFNAMAALLSRTGHLVQATLTTKGLALRRLYVEAGLVLSECLSAGLFDGLESPELAAATSLFTPRTSGGAATEVLPTVTLRHIWESAAQTTSEFERLASPLGLAVSGPDRSLAPALYRWVETSNLAEALGGSGLTPGDLAREARQVAELLDQVVHASPSLELVAEQTQAKLLASPL